MFFVFFLKFFEYRIPMWVHWVKFLSSVQVQNGYKDEKTPAASPAAQGRVKVGRLSSLAELLVENCWASWNHFISAPTMTRSAQVVFEVKVFHCWVRYDISATEAHATHPLWGYVQLLLNSTQPRMPCCKPWQRVQPGLANLATSHLIFSIYSKQSFSMLLFFACIL